MAYDAGRGDAQAADSVDRLNAHPNFQILVYPGPLGVPDAVPAHAPPAFLIAANDDTCCSAPIVQLLERYRLAKVPVEAHLLAQGNHAFNMGYRSSLQSVKAWPQLLTNWLADNHILSPQPALSK